MPLIMASIGMIQELQGVYTILLVPLVYVCVQSVGLTSLCVVYNMCKYLYSQVVGAMAWSLLLLFPLTRHYSN